MSRRSLRLQTGGAGLYGNDSHADGPQNHVSYTTNTTTSSSSRKETRTPRNRKQQQAVSQTLSLSQMDTPRQTLSFSALSTPVAGGGLQHAGLATDTTLLSSTSASTSVPGQASLRQRASTTTTTTADGYWGSGHDVELTGRSTSHGHGLNGGAASSVSKSSQHTTAANGYICKDCSPSTGGLSAHCASSSSSSSSLGAQAAASATGAFSSFSSSSSLSSSSMSPSSSIYSRDKSRRNKTGVLASVSSTCVRYCSKAVAPVVSLFTLLFSSVLWLGSRARSQGKGYLTSFSDSVRRVVTSSMSSVWLFKQNAVRRIRGHRAAGYEGEAHSSFCGSMNVKDLVTGDSSHLKLNGSLCDDCKGKQSSHAAVTQSVLLLSQSATQSATQSTTQSSTQSSTQSRTQRLGGALLSFLAYTGSCLLVPGYGVVRAGKALGSGAGVAVYTVVHTVFRKLVSLICFVLAAPVRVGWGLLWFLATGWYQLVSFMSLLNVFFLTRCVPLLWRLLLLLLPLLLLLALWWWGPSTAALLAYLPATNLSLWWPASPLVLLSSLLPASGPPPARVLEAEPTLSHATPAPPISAVPPALPPPAAAAAVALASLDLERLERLEQRLALLWEQVQRGDQQQEQRFGDTLVLHSSLREELRTQTDRESLGLWVSGLLEGKLGALRAELEEGDAHRAQKEELLQQSRAERLAEVESLLALLASRTEEVQQKQHQFKVEREEETRKAMREAAILAEAPDVPVAPISVGVNQEDHEALLAEVRRLEAELGRVRADLQGVLGCKGKCGQLDTLHDTISAQVSSEVSSQVRRELRALFYGSGQAGEGHHGDGDDALPESLVLWLSERYVGGPELQASLAALELAILSDVSQQLERSRAQALLDAQAQAQSVSETVRQTVSHSVQHSATAQGLSEEQVQLIVQNALRLYSQDRTGLVDYALESGGGSILSTRCSETYETKTALMSLFGLPLWYFSQSPRVVIQPDVYPGNCWAFKGSQGYLVIRLSLRVKPTAFCLEHIPKSMSPTGTITSAPRNFTVYGLGDEYQEEGQLLGEYVYQEDGDSLQTFPVMKNEQAFQIIEVRVLSNWGHPEYTCLYRFRVHGEPRPQQ